MLDLIVVDNPQLVYKAVRVLFRHFSKNEELLHACKEVYISFYFLFIYFFFYFFFFS